MRKLNVQTRKIIENDINNPLLTRNQKAERAGISVSTYHYEIGPFFNQSYTAEKGQELADHRLASAKKEREERTRFKKQKLIEVRNSFKKQKYMDVNVNESKEISEDLKNRVEQLEITVAVLLEIVKEIQNHANS